MNKHFEGCYYKHQKGNHTLCLITGIADGKKFIQIITENASWTAPFTKQNHFSSNGIVLNIKTDQISLTGKIAYGVLSPLKYDIMGPFRYFPMECRHHILSMHHRLYGTVVLNGKPINFTGGRGYMEADSGTSFPSSYVWIQANNRLAICSVMAAAARIPFFGFHFPGCICVICYRQKEYRLATYLGVRILSCTENELILKQGKYRLKIRIGQTEGQPLLAPQNGKMERTIQEAAACPATICFYMEKKKVFRLRTRQASFEYESKKSAPTPPDHISP